MFRIWLCALALAFAGVLALPAQQALNYANVSGRVTDAAGAVIPGAQVSILRIATNQSTHADADASGRFHFGYLAPGDYQLQVSQTGFSTFRQKLTLTIGGAFDVPVRLALATQQSQVVVTGTAPVLERAQTQIAGTISPREIASLPISGRNFLDLALLVPGVSPTNTGSSQTFAETSAVPGQGISVSSQRNFSNSFIVDGLSANDDAAGLTGTFYDQDVVDQFQVVTSGGQAEFGRALGGYVNMVTKSGTSTLHGDAYGYFRNQRLNADNALTGAKLPMTQAQYGASLGGPVGHGHTFYFANFERRDLNQDGLITIAPSDLAVINSTLASDGYLGPQITTGLYPNPVHNTNLFARLDRAFSENDQFNLRYSAYDVHSANSRGVGGLSAVSAAAALADNDQTLALSNVWALSPQTVNETRAQLTYDNLSAPPNDAIGPAVNISGVASFGRLSSSPTARRNWLYEFVDNLSHQAGAHALKTGVDFLYNDLAITFPQNSRGSYSFASLANFESGIYNNSGFAQSFGNPVVRQSNPNLGVYGQDAWTVTPRLTLNLGLRYDLQFLQGVATDTNNLSPRLGFAWTPFAAGRTVVRGSFGVFYDRVPLRAVSNALQSSGNTTVVTPATFVTATLSPFQTGAPAFPNLLAGLPPGVLVNFTTMDPQMQNAYSEQASLELAQQIGTQAALAVSYQHVRGVRLVIDVNRNPPTCVATGTNNGCRAISAYGDNKQYSPLANSQYDALGVSFLHHAGRWGSARLSYTYSKAFDDVGEFFFSSPINNFNIWQDWGRSDDDQRQRLVLDGTAHTPTGPAHTSWQRLAHGFEFGATLQAYSAPPFTVVTGGRTVQGTTARPLLADGSTLGRNTGNGFDFLSLDTRLSRNFALGEHGNLQLIAEAFNTLNRRNNLYPNATFGSGAYPGAGLPNFGQPTAVGDPRTVQLALRLSF